MNLFKQGLFFIFLSSFAIKCFAQTNSKANHGKVSETVQLGLDKYMWGNEKFKAGNSVKKPLDFDAIDNWQGMGDHLSISNDGKYYAYNIERGIGLPRKKLDSLIVQSVDGNWRKVFTNYSDNEGFFSADNKQYIFKTAKGQFSIELGADALLPFTATESKKVNQPAVVAKSAWVQKQIKQSDTLKAGIKNVAVEVWNYKDSIIQSGQSKELKPIVAIINLETEKTFLLANEWEACQEIKNEHAIVMRSGKQTHGDRFWEKGYNEDSVWLVSLKDSTRKLLPIKKYHDIWFSPGGNFLVYFEGRNCHYFSYDLRTGKITDISSNVPQEQMGVIGRYNFTDKKPEYSCGLAAWLQDDAGLLVYDNTDIWKLDLTGKKPAINITNGYGRSHNIIFSLMEGVRNWGATPVLKDNEMLLLRAFNSSNKMNGYYRKDAGIAGDPELLSMEPYFLNMISWCQDPNLSNEGKKPVKAKDSETWIVQRQSVNDAPNYYKTTDFKSFKKLTDFQPQKAYSWLFEELHTFSHLDGKKGQGILYKPENFDPTKKYPVLIVFYGGYSNNMHQFPVPSYNYNAIAPGSSPQWFLNNGYLVFTPDIYTSPKKYGPLAFNMIEGATKFLKSRSYVDPNGIGCASHSWSSKMGAYLYTHSKSLSAIAMSEGYLYGNLINVALSNKDGNGLEAVENGFEYGSLWENKASWLDQTTVLNVDKSTMPLLLFCNKKSSEEYQNQTLQIFSAGRRLEKKVWWLKYEKGGHNVNDLDEQKDYTIRYTQFFDHYLKQAPAPKWMTQGIPNKLKGIEARYELDAAGSCAMQGKNTCHICQAWNKQYARTPTMFEKKIKEWELDKDIKGELDKKTKTERAKLDKEGAIESKKIVDILKDGYPEDEKRKKSFSLRSE